MQMKVSIDLTDGQSLALAKLLVIAANPTQLNLTVDFVIRDTYIPASLYTPAEYPEFEFQGIDSAEVEFWNEVTNLTTQVKVPQSKFKYIEDNILTGCNYDLIQTLGFEFMEGYDND